MVSHPRATSKETGATSQPARQKEETHRRARSSPQKGLFARHSTIRSTLGEPLDLGGPLDREKERTGLFGLDHPVCDSAIRRTQPATVGNLVVRTVQFLHPLPQGSCVCSRQRHAPLKTRPTPAPSTSSLAGPWQKLLSGCPVLVALAHATSSKLQSSTIQMPSSPPDYHNCSKGAPEAVAKMAVAQSTKAKPASKANNGGTKSKAKTQMHRRSRTGN